MADGRLGPLGMQLCCVVMVRKIRCGWGVGERDESEGKGAGLPELEELLQLGENSPEAGHDEGVNGGGQAAVRTRRSGGDRKSVV